jgi:hypothetical protein
LEKEIQESEKRLEMMRRKHEEEDDRPEEKILDLPVVYE